MSLLAATLVTLLVVLAILTSPFLLAATLSWWQSGRFGLRLEGDASSGRPRADAEARFAHRLPLLRAAAVLALLAPSGVAWALAFDVPLPVPLAAALPLAAAIVPMTWAERAWSQRPWHVVWITLLIATGAGLAAIVNGLAVAHGGGPDAWLGFVQERLDRRGESVIVALLLVVPALTMWAIPCAIVTDVRVREGANRAAMTLVAFIALGPAVVSIGLLELAYRAAAWADFRLGGE